MNVFRVSFLIVTDILVVAMLVSLLAACVATPQRDRNGDFVSHMASAQVETQPTAPAASSSAPRA